MVQWFCTCRLVEEIDLQCSSLATNKYMARSVTYG